MRRRLAALAVASFLAVPLGADEKAAAAPRIRVEPEGFDFGKAQPGKTLRKEFTLRNFGDADAGHRGRLDHLRLHRRPLRGESRRAGRPDRRCGSRSRPAPSRGRWRRQVLVRSNDPKTPLLQVRVSATVEPVTRAR